MLEVLLDDIVAFAEDYYERQVDRNAVEHIVTHVPLTESIVQALNPEATLADLHADIATKRIAACAYTGRGVRQPCTRHLGVPVSDSSVAPREKGQTA